MFISGFFSSVLKKHETFTPFFLCPEHYHDRKTFLIHIERPTIGDCNCAILKFENNKTESYTARNLQIVGVG